MEEFSFCYKGSLGRFFLLKRSCRNMAFDTYDMKGILGFKFSRNTSIPGFPNKQLISIIKY